MQTYIKNDEMIHNMCDINKIEGVISMERLLYFSSQERKKSNGITIRKEALYAAFTLDLSVANKQDSVAPKSIFVFLVELWCFGEVSNILFSSTFVVRLRKNLKHFLYISS